MIEKKTRKNGLHYFIAKADNGEIVATSPDYDSEILLDNAISSLKKIVGKVMNNDIWREIKFTEEI